VLPAAHADGLIRRGSCKLQWSWENYRLLISLLCEHCVFFRMVKVACRLQQFSHRQNR
jgi:hypothetical protein